MVPKLQAANWPHPHDVVIASVRTRRAAAPAPREELGTRVILWLTAGGAQTLHLSGSMPRRVAVDAGAARALARWGSCCGGDGAGSAISKRDTVAWWGRRHTDRGGVITIRRRPGQMCGRQSAEIETIQAIRRRRDHPQQQHGVGVIIFNHETLRHEKIQIFIFSVHSVLRGLLFKSGNNENRIPLQQAKSASRRLAGRQGDRPRLCWRRRPGVGDRDAIWPPTRPIWRRKANACPPPCWTGCCSTCSAWPVSSPTCAMCRMPDPVARSSRSRPANGLRLRKQRIRWG